MTDTQSKEQLVQLVLLAFGQRRQQIIRRLFAHTLQLQQILLAQAVQIRSIAHKARIKQRIDNRRTAAIDIHRITADKVNQTLASQRRAMRIGAADSCLLALTLYTPAAFRADAGNFYLFFVTGALFSNYAQYLGNNFTGLVDNNPVTDADILGTDKVLVMQGCTADNAAA